MYSSMREFSFPTIHIRLEGTVRGDLIYCDVKQNDEQVD